MQYLSLSLLSSLCVGYVVRACEWRRSVATCTSVPHCCSEWLTGGHLLVVRVCLFVCVCVVCIARMCVFVLFLYGVEVQVVVVF